MPTKRWVNARLATNSLAVSGANAALSVLALIAFLIPRFTNLGLGLCLLILILLGFAVLLAVLDLLKSGTRVRFLGTVVLWLPVLFLFGMMVQWEGPLYVTAQGNVPTFEMSGLAGFCGLAIYSPAHDGAEWYDDDIGLAWSIESEPHHFLTTAKVTYAAVPPRFTQVFPAQNLPPSPLDQRVTYKLVVGRCDGGPQYLSLLGDQLSEYKPNLSVCWGELKVPGRKYSAQVRVDCKTRQPLPMSDRAKQRLEAYRQNKIEAY